MQLNNQENIDNNKEIGVLSENKNKTNVSSATSALNNVSISDKIDKQEIKDELDCKMASQKYPSSLDKEEPLCIESKNRFVLFPIANQEVMCTIYISV